MASMLSRQLRTAAARSPRVGHRARSAASASGSGAAQLKIYGIGVSQPVRTLLWACHMQGLEHELVYRPGVRAAWPRAQT